MTTAEAIDNQPYESLFRNVHLIGLMQQNKTHKIKIHSWLILSDSSNSSNQTIIMKKVHNRAFYFWFVQFVKCLKNWSSSDRSFNFISFEPISKIPRSKSFHDPSVQLVRMDVIGTFGGQRLKNCITKLESINKHRYELCTCIEINTYANKKVLLCECKRHTACCIASTCYAVLVGVPPILGSDLDGGYPCPPPPPPTMGSDLGRGYPPTPCLDLGRGTPCPHSLPGPEKGYPPCPPTWIWEGVPLTWTWEEGTPLSAGWWYPPYNGGQSENITFRHPLVVGSKNNQY